MAVVAFDEASVDTCPNRLRRLSIIAGVQSELNNNLYLSVFKYRTPITPKTDITQRVTDNVFTNNTPGMATAQTYQISYRNWLTKKVKVIWTD